MPSLDPPTSLPIRQPLRLVADDGVELRGSLFDPGPARGTVLVHSAAAVPHGFYDRLAWWLAERGYRVVTYDYRGVGASRPQSLAHFEATMTDWARLDAVAALRFVERAYPGEPVLLMGHSFGGQLLGLVDEMARVDAAVLIGSSLAYFGHWPVPSRYGMGLAWSALVPAITSTLGYLPGRLLGGEDLPAGAAREWARWCLSPNYLIDHDARAEQRFERFTAPVLLWSFTDDEYAPRPAVDALARALPRASLHRRLVEPREVGTATIGHFGFFHARHQATLWRDTGDFLDAVVAGHDTSRFRPDESSTANGVFTASDVLLDLEYGRA